jgi:predicted MFS family arabinose efflux permease
MNVLKDQIKNYSIIFRDQVFFLFVFAGLILSQTFMQLDMLIPIYIKHSFEKVNVHLFDWFQTTLSPEGFYAVIVSENGLLVVLFALTIAKFVSRFHEKWIMFLSSVFYGVGMLIFLLSTNFYGYLLAMFVYTIAEIMTAGIMNGFVAKIAPEDQRATYFAASGIRYSLGRAIAPLSITFSGLFGFTWTFSVIIFLSVLSGFIYLWMYRIFEQRKALSK